MTRYIPALLLLAACDGTAVVDTDTGIPVDTDVREWRELPDQIILVFDADTSNESIVWGVSNELQAVIDYAPTTWGVLVVYDEGGQYTTLQETDSIDPIEVDFIEASEGFKPLAAIEKANGDDPVRDTVWWYIASQRDSEDTGNSVLPEGHILVPRKPGLAMIDHATDVLGGFPCDGGFGCLYEP